jgi:hypothetical protein
MKFIHIQISFAFILALFSCHTIVQAQEISSADQILQTFKYMFEVTNPNIVVPTVVETTIPNQIYSQHFAVYNKTKNTFEPYYVGKTTGKNMLVPSVIKVNNTIVNQDIFDSDFKTYIEFEVSDEGVGKTQVLYSFPSSIESDSLYISLNQYVSLPNNVTIKVIENGKEKILASRIKPNSSIINFPKTSASTWIIELEYSQPLRINELQIHNSYLTSNSSIVRFLAQPNDAYVIYAEPDRIINQSTGERPDLFSNVDIKKILVGSMQTNPAYMLADSDGDTIPDIQDNCVLDKNKDQTDINANQRGDVCDDFDKDGVINIKDNCVNGPNRGQEDEDNDGIGDVCDTEESRITEKYPWIVWGSMMFAGLLFLGLFAVAIRKIRFADVQKNNVTISPQDNTPHNPPTI